MKNEGINSKEGGREEEGHQRIEEGANYVGVRRRFVLLAARDQHQPPQPPTKPTTKPQPLITTITISKPHS